MNMESKLLYYDNIATFKHKFSEKLLTAEHLSGGQVKISSLHYPDSDIDEEANFWGYILEKDKIKYLLPATDEEGKEIVLRNVLPILPMATQKVASKGVAYLQIVSYVSAKIKPEQHYSFRELVDILTSFEVTNPEHNKLVMFNGITSLFSRYNHRICSPAGSGKDSSVDILGNLYGDCQSIVSPTYAKLEERAVVLKWLAINEAVDVSSTEWKIIQQYLLDFGAHRPKVLKHSKAHGIVGEEIDATEFSISLMYNDVDHYPEPKKYFDFTTKAQVCDRYPAFRIYNDFTEDFNQINDIDIDKFVAKHYETYKKVLSTIEYYKLNWNKCLHNYDKSMLPSYSQRYTLNLGRLLNIIDMYCNDQEEFNKWITVIVKSLADYKAMLKYPTMVQQLSSKFGIKKEDSKQFKKMHYITEYLLGQDPDMKQEHTEHRIAYITKIDKALTYIEKQKLVDAYGDTNKTHRVEDKRFW